MLAIVAIPVVLYLFNVLLRWLDRRQFHQWIKPTHLDLNYLGLLPDLPIVVGLGIGFAFFLRYSIRSRRFYTLSLTINEMRLGFHDLFGVTVGSAALWFIFYRHGALPVFLVAANGALPVIGFALGRLWELFYRRLIVRFIDLPFDEFIARTVEGTLAGTAHFAELFRVQEVSVDLPNRAITVTGRSGPRFPSEKGDQLIRRAIRDIRVVAQNITEVRLDLLP